jgi:aminoglycoside phosphotransferase (APT) family kinase protein
MAITETQRTAWEVPQSIHEAESRILDLVESIENIQMLQLGNPEKRDSFNSDFEYEQWAIHAKTSLQRRLDNLRRTKQWLKDQRADEVFI